MVITEEAEVFVPEHTFADFHFTDLLKRAIEDRGYTNPTPIQDKVIPSILRGLDVVGLANTGTGKTAAFLLPIIHKVLGDRNQQVLILAPTRELAMQIDEEFRLFAKKLILSSVVCVGGASIENQIRQLRRKNSFVIGTPGRIIDLIKRGVLRLDNVKTVVLDEADRMLDMGFIQDIRLIMSHVPKERHTLCFSATMSPNIQTLVRDFLQNPMMVSVKTQDTAKNVEQDIVHLRGREKSEMLHELLLQKEFSKVLVFGRTKYGVEKLCRALVHKGIRAESIHSNKTQSQRFRALASFKKGNVQVLVATDIAARGLDIESVTHVINYDLPATYEDYVHRVGRTGRGTHRGKALTFIE